MLKVALKIMVQTYSTMNWETEKTRKCEYLFQLMLGLLNRYRKQPTARTDCRASFFRRNCGMWDAYIQYHLPAYGPSAQ